MDGYTQDQIRKAILKAADHVDEDPRRYQFMAARVPREDDQAGCALGWIGYFLGFSERWTCHTTVSQWAFGVDPMDFYREMSRLEKEDRSRWSDEQAARGWTLDPEIMTHCLRRYAERYSA